MEMLQAIVLGLIQGLGEFLPISSSGHLVVLPKIFEWTDQGLAFDVALHIGTLLALLIFFYQDWKNIILKSHLIRQTEKIFIERKREFFSWKKLKEDILFIILLATVPGALAGLFLEDYISTVFRNPILVAFTLFGGAVLLFISDKSSKRNINKISDIGIKKGLAIGVFQALAVVPGVSRSGITITAGLFGGLDREKSAEFSFLLAAPIIFGAGVKELPELLSNGFDLNMLVGVAVSFVSGYLAIKFMLGYLRKKNYNIFVVYRMVLALIIFINFI